MGFRHIKSSHTPPLKEDTGSGTDMFSTGNRSELHWELARIFRVKFLSLFKQFPHEVHESLSIYYLLLARDTIPY